MRTLSCLDDFNH